MKCNFIILFGFICACSCAKPECIGYIAKPQIKSALDVPSSNPYSLENMQKAYESLMASVATKSNTPDSLDATDYYVCFTPVDSIEYRNLMELELELFDYPLVEDRKLMDSYSALAELDSSALGYVAKVYTVIPKRMVKENITHQMIKEASFYEEGVPFTYIEGDNVKGSIIEDCYIPENDVENATKSSFIDTDELECLAFSVAGVNVPDTKALSKTVAKGKVCYVRVEEDGVEYPLVGVKVVNQSYVRWNVSYTDDKGYFSTTEKFHFYPNVVVRFESSQDKFKIWNKFNFLTAASYKCDSKKNSFDRKIVFNEYSPTSRSWAQVFMAVHEYYEMCRSDGIKLPPSDLRIDVFGASQFSSAPMLSHVRKQLVGVLGNVVEDYVEICCPIGLASFVVRGSLFLLKNALPDLLLGTQGYDYNKTRVTVFHELSHASHFSVVGANYWVKFIEYICASVLRNKECYGDGSLRNDAQRICELGEAWAYANSRFFGYAGAGETIWFDPAITAIHYVLDTLGLTRRNVFDCLSPQTEDIDGLFQNLINRYHKVANELNDYLIDRKVVRHYSSWTVKLGQVDALGQMILSTKYDGKMKSVYKGVGGDSYVVRLIGDNCMFSFARSSFLFPSEINILFNSYRIRNYYREVNGKIEVDDLYTFNSDNYWETSLEYDSATDTYVRTNCYTFYPIVE